MILDVLLWLPCKVLRHYLSPVTDMLDRLGEMTNEAIDEALDNAASNVS